MPDLRPLLLATPLLVAGCASTSDAIVRQGDISPTQCATIGWPPSAVALSQAEEQVRQEVDGGLRAKGYAVGAADPTCRLDASFMTRPNLSSAGTPTVGVGGGGGSGGAFGGIGITLPVGGSSKTPGTFTLRVIYTSLNREIWSGIVDGKFDSQELSPSETTEVVNKVLEKFPARGTTP